MELANLEGLAEAEVVDVDDQTLRHCGIDGFHLEFLHGEGELTTGLNTFGVAFKLHGHGDNYGLGIVDLKQVDVKDVVLYGVELHFAEHSHLLFAVGFELDSEDVGGVDELAHVVVLDSEVGSDDTTAILDLHDLLAGLESAGEGEVEGLATIEDYGNFTFVTKCFCCFLTEVGTGLGNEAVSFHCCKSVNCVTQN